MPQKDITNPAIIKFLGENYEKESYLRQHWIEAHQSEIQKAATLQRKPTNYYEKDIVAHQMKAGMAILIRDNVTASFNRKKVPIRDGTSIPCLDHILHGHSIVDIGLGDPKDDPRLARPVYDMAIDPVMRPVDQKTTKILYKDQPMFGREQYLAEREKILPEKKFYFMQCSSWEYGWRLGDSAMTTQLRRGRNWYLMSALRSRVGPAPDPSYYQSADTRNQSKCL